MVKKQEPKKDHAQQVQAVYEDVMKLLHNNKLSYLEMVGILEIAKGNILRELEASAVQVVLKENQQEEKRKGDYSYIG